MTSTPPSFEEAKSAPQAKPAPHPAAPPAAAEKAVDLAVGTATAVAHAESEKDGNVAAATPVSAPPRDQGSSGSSVLSLPAAIVLGLGLLVAGGRAGLHLWDRRAKRRLQEARWSREADWEVVLRRIELNRTLGASTANGERLKAEIGSHPRN